MDLNPIIIQIENIGIVEIHNKGSKVLVDGDMFRKLLFDSELITDLIVNTRELLRYKKGSIDTFITVKDFDYEHCPYISFKNNDVSFCMGCDGIEMKMGTMYEDYRITVQNTYANNIIDHLVESRDNAYILYECLPSIIPVNQKRVN